MPLTDMSPADLAKQMEVWRQQNITNRQTAATANVAQQTPFDVQRQQQVPREIRSKRVGKRSPMARLTTASPGKPNTRRRRASGRRLSVPMASPPFPWKAARVAHAISAGSGSAGGCWLSGAKGGLSGRCLQDLKRWRRTLASRMQLA